MQVCNTCNELTNQDICYTCHSNITLCELCGKRPPTEGYESCWQCYSSSFTETCMDCGTECADKKRCFMCHAISIGRQACVSCEQKYCVRQYLTCYHCYMDERDQQRHSPSLDPSITIDPDASVNPTVIVDPQPVQALFNACMACDQPCLLKYCDSCFIPSARSIRRKKKREAWKKSVQN
jgi:hypothetical protein